MCLGSAAGLLTIRSTSPFLDARPAAGESRNGDQVIGDDAQPNPAMHAIEPAIATARQSMTSLQHADPSFGPGAPALPAAKPALVFMGATRGDFRPRRATRHVGRRGAVAACSLAAEREARVAGREIRSAGKDLLMAIECGGPQRDIGRTVVMDVVRGDDLMFGFLNRHQFAEFRGLRLLALCGSLRCAVRRRSGLCRPRGRRRRAAARVFGARPVRRSAAAAETLLHRAATVARWSAVHRAQALTHAADHRHGLAQHRPGRAHQLAIAADQRGAASLTPRLQPNRDTPARDTPPPIADPRRRLAERRHIRCCIVRVKAGRRPAATCCRSDSARWFLRPWCRCEIGGRA